MVFFIHSQLTLRLEPLKLTMYPSRLTHSRRRFSWVIEFAALWPLPCLG